MLRVAQALLLIATLTATAQARARLGRPELDQLWQDFKERYGKQYLNEIEGVRRLIWEDNYDFMQEHNTAFRSGELTFEVGENEFNDLTTDEFVSMLNGYKMSEEPRTNPIFVPKREFAPTKVDWRAKGFVTPVKNQGHCGSCWAFSATGSLEGQHFNKTKKLVSLSEQNLVDCATKEGNHGCLGGIMDKAFMYVKDNKGIDTEASYPYTAKNGACKFNATNVGANLTSWTDIKSGSEMDLALAVSQIGPISVAIDAGHKSFQMYKKGVYKEKECSSTHLDHGVLVVGYVQQMEADGKRSGHWIVKNSWGTSWGMKGYINMAKDHDNMCGIATDASFPVV